MVFGKTTGKKRTDIDNVKRILNSESDFYTVETYKSIRTNIMFSIPKSETGKVIVVTSSAPGEGKTTTSINLAITFALMGAKVALVDCDLRKARVHRYLQIDRADGVSNVLCGFTTLEKAIHKNVRENLDVLTAGEIPPNPAELLETEAFAALVEELKSKYDYVFIDTPPLSVVTDASVAMKQSTGVVVVVRENSTTYDLLDSTMESIRKTEVKILGFVMVGCEGSHGKYGYYRKGSYGNKYGYKYKYDYRYADDEEHEKNGSHEKSGSHGKKQ